MSAEGGIYQARLPALLAGRPPKHFTGLVAIVQEQGMPAVQRANRASVAAFAARFAKCFRNFAGVSIWRSLIKPWQVHLLRFCARQRRTAHFSCFAFQPDGRVAAYLQVAVPVAPALANKQPRYAAVDAAHRDATSPSKKCSSSSSRISS